MRFTIPGEPVGKGRPRVVRRGGVTQSFTPQKTVVYENLVKMCFRQQCRGGFFDGEALRMHLVMYYGLPKHDSKVRRQMKLDGETRPTKKPDIDNCIKVVADALNGVAYRDDTQIVEVTATKYYAAQPHVDVVIEVI